MNVINVGDLLYIHPSYDYVLALEVNYYIFLDLESLRKRQSERYKPEESNNYLRRLLVTDIFRKEDNE